jgi:hypothetical protein
VSLQSSLPSPARALTLEVKTTLKARTKGITCQFFQIHRDPSESFPSRIRTLAAYASDESGRWEVYVQPYPGPGGKVQISTDGGKETALESQRERTFLPQWGQGDGHTGELAANVFGRQDRIAFQKDIIFPPTHLYPNMTFSRMASAFLMVKYAAADQSATQINIVQNWFIELQERVPVK